MKLSQVILNESPLPPQQYAWDGRTLWINATLRKPATLGLRFAE
jgi:hypothetical protein